MWQISCILCTLSTFDGNKLTRMFMGNSVIENILSSEWWCGRKSRKAYFWLSKILQENGKIVFKWVKALYLLQNRRWSQQTEAVTAYYPAVSLSRLFPQQILPPAAAIETRATPHCRLSGCCSNLSYLFAKYFYHLCSYNVADNKVWCLHRIFLRTSCYIQ